MPLNVRWEGVFRLEEEMICDAEGAVGEILLSAASNATYFMEVALPTAKIVCCQLLLRITHSVLNEVIAQVKSISDRVS